MKKLLIVMACIFAALRGFAQTGIHGRIFNAADSSALSGVSIRVEPANQATISDQEGKFNFKLTKGKYTLILSHVGFESQRLNFQAESALNKNIYLKAISNDLQEVVVHTGYQDLPKERATGSFVSLNANKLNEQFSTNILSRLEAIANSVSVNHRSSGDGNLMVRGLSTISGPVAPLIVLDNFPYQGDLNNINPNDVESITILKDAAASSIWGSRAGNGVIVITTKKAKAGEALQIDFNANMSVVEQPNLFALSQMTVSDFISVEQFLYGKGYYTSKINSASKPALSPVVELLVANSKGNLSASALQQALTSLGQADTRQNLLNTNYRDAVNRQLALSLRAGGKWADWNFSVGYDGNTSALSANSSRLNLSSNNTVRLYKSLVLDAGLRFTQSESDGGKAGYSDMASSTNIIYPYLSLEDANGNALPLAKNYSLSYLNGLNNPALSDWKYYPLTDYQQNELKQKTQDMLANFGLSMDIVKGLKASVRYQYEQQRTESRNLYGANSFTVRSLVNAFTQVNGTGAAVYKVPKGALLDQTESVLSAQNLRGQLSYSHTWGLHALNILTGAELNQNKTTGRGNRTFGYNDENLGFSYPDLSTTYPNFVTGALGYIDDGPTDFQALLNRFVSVYGNAAYTYKERYTLSASARKDASNLFGLNTNDKWKPLWSVGLGWDIAAEPFYQLSWLEGLKLRASYGFSGNVDQSKTAVTTLLNTTVSPYTGSMMSRFNQFGNPDLRWEQVGTINIGLDFSMFQGRLSGSLELYRKHATDLYGASPVDYTAVPEVSLIKNVASMEAKGLDLALRSKNLNGKFSWVTDLNFSLYRDKILDYYQPSDQGNLYVGNGNFIVAAKGYPVYALFSYKWAGLDGKNGNPLGYLAGAVSSDYASITGAGTNLKDLNYDGPIFPTVYGNIGNTFSYEHLSLTFRLNYKLGYFFQAAEYRLRKTLQFGFKPCRLCYALAKPGR
jgi:TonB-linked SusC/RagA family outer membrane protein